jgi:O-antigen/teichoic acid export membrane protein
MANIRKQAIISSILVYAGFLVGAINIYLYTKNGSFTEAEFGLTRLFFDVAQNFYAFGSLGFIAVMYKFYPYYKDNLPRRENDLLTWGLLSAFIGFIVLVILGLVFEPIVVRKFSERSALFVQYYHWIFPFAFGMLFFSMLEGYAWALQKTVVSNFLKETGLRLITTIIISLNLFGIINFTQFVQLFAFMYLFIFLALLVYLISIGHFHITFKISRVTKKFWKKMATMQSLIFGGIVIGSLGQTIDGILIASLKGLSSAGIYTLAQYVANLVQVPQRSIQSISTGVLAQAWKDKNYPEINRIYSRSCINLLLMALFIFGNIILNVKEAITILGIQANYLTGLEVMMVLGLVRLVDAGTGVNGTIIATSNYWKFDFISGVVMLTILIPLNYYLIVHYGIVGSAYAQLIAYTIYNFIRFEFLRRKFGFQPFNQKTLFALLLGFAALAIAYFLFASTESWLGIFSRCIVFSALMIAGVFYFELTPDAMQLYYKWKERKR